MKSYEECEIANFLYLNGIAYEYEAPYEHETATAEKRQYKPDFFLPDHGIYIEHFGLDAAGNTAAFVDRGNISRRSSGSAGSMPNGAPSWSRPLRAKRAEGLLIRILEEKLAVHGGGADCRFLGSGCSPSSKTRDGSTRSSPSWRPSCSTSRAAGFPWTRSPNGPVPSIVEGRAEAFLVVFGPIFERYQATLARAGEIDFHDAITRATDHVDASRYRSPFGCATGLPRLSRQPVSENILIGSSFFGL